MSPGTPTRSEWPARYFNPLFSLPGLAFSVRDVSLDQCGAGSLNQCSD